MPPKKTDSPKILSETTRESFKLVRTDGIFALEVPTANGNTKIIGKFKVEDFREPGFFQAKCSNPNGLTTDIINNTKLYYPALVNDKYIMASEILNKICSNIDGFIQFAQTTQNNYFESKANKNDFESQLDQLPVLPSIMSDEEATMYVKGLENLSLDEWIPSLPDSLHIENYQLIIDSWKQIRPEFNPDRQIPTINSQTIIFNGLLSHFLTIELLSAIKDDIPNNSSDDIINTINENITDDTEFKDIKELIKLERPELLPVYEAYYMLKCMCFILHDKPVNELAPFLLKYFEQRMGTSPLIIELKRIYISGFSINGDTAQVTQKRSHKTLDELTKYFKTLFSKYPEMIKVYSIPYAAFKIEKTNSKDIDEDEDLEDDMSIFKELKQYLLPFVYGLGDAVGPKTFITQMDKISIYPNTLSLQDAAGSTQLNTDQEIVVSETIDRNTLQSVYVISEQGTSLNIEIEPLHFLDVEIRCLKLNIQGQMVNFFLYYAFGFDNINTSIYSNITVTVPLAKPINHNATNDLKPYLFINGKKMIGVITSKVSQNDTIPIINDYIDIEKSKRGKGKIRTNPYIWWIYKDSNNDIEEIVRVLLGTLAKEAGDQSKIQIVENLSRNGKPSYVATVDSFFSHSLIQGGVIFKGGNIEVFIPQGFQSLNKEQKINIMKLLQKINNYGYNTIAGKIKNFLDKTTQIINTILLNPNVQLPDTTKLILFAIFKEFGNIENFITQDRYITLYNNGQYDVTKNSGIFDELSFLRRLINFDRVSRLFSLLDDELQDRFYIQLGKDKIKGDIIDMVDKYLLNTFTADEISPPTDEIQEKIKVYFEQIPLLFLMRNIEKINNTNNFYRSRDRTYASATTGRSEKIVAPFINNILRDVLISKMSDFCQTYKIPEIYDKYIQDYRLPPQIGGEKEIVFEDEDHPTVEILEEIGDHLIADNSGITALFPETTNPYLETNLDSNSVLQGSTALESPISENIPSTLDQQIAEDYSLVDTALDQHIVDTTKKRKLDPKDAYEPIARRTRSSFSGGKRKTRKLKSKTHKKRTHQKAPKRQTKRPVKRLPNRSRKAHKPLKTK